MLEFETAARRFKDELRRIGKEAQYVKELLGDDALFASTLVFGIIMMVIGLVFGIGVNAICAIIMTVGAYFAVTLATLRLAPNFSHFTRFTKADISALLSDIPIETYIRCDDKRPDVYDGEVKSMRGKIISEGTNKHEDLVKWHNTRRRKFSDACCICFEEFEEGNKLRVLRCGHEYHKFCMDKWVYSFASISASHSSVPRGDPHCPLCKSNLLQANAQKSRM
mmetsp:Transcript_31338/g.93827  ORF Transcript_31338/g.93827 Transcript_31338/m.93827 type:complete len:223 (-) Transcript_31338:149-817(-)